MKNGRYIQCLLWNFKAHTPIYLRGKYTNNRAKNMKLDSIFFTASAVYIRGLLNFDFQKSFSINGLVIYIYSVRRG